MKLEVLGCAGGIGGKQRYTTCLQVDDDILLDAGTGVTTLDIEAMARIDHIFITHSHLDHVAGLALLADVVRGRRDRPVTVHASHQVLAALRTHLFNWILWPDFSVIPNKENPVLTWSPFEPGTTIAIGERRITPYTVNHNAGSVGYQVENDHDGFLFTGDMCSTPQLWPVLLARHKLSKVIVDCSFPNAELELSWLSKHFCPQTLLEEIADVPDSVEFLIYHLKPGQEDLIMEQLTVPEGKRSFRALSCNDVFLFK